MKRNFKNESMIIYDQENKLKQKVSLRKLRGDWLKQVRFKTVLKLLQVIKLQVYLMFQTHWVSSSGVAELANAPVVHPRGPVLNLGNDKNLF
jgi:hypothetical protein